MDKLFPFSDLKILDFTTEMGSYCTKLFADLGASVLKVEPLQGDSTREIGPFLHDENNVETSLYHHFLNTNKKSITLDLTSSSGQQIIKDLVREYDIVVENFTPGYLSSLGIGYEQLQEINPKIIVTSITPFGQNGPYKNYKATDIIGVAMGGLMYLGGFPDTPPVRPFGNQAYFAASLFGAIGTVLAVIHRDQNREGQMVDVSMQESIAVALENAIQFYDLEGKVRKRVGSAGFQAGWGLYPCADGQVFIMASGMTGSKSWEQLVQWLADENIENWETLNDPRWLELDWRSSEEGKKEFYSLLTKLTLPKNKLELYEEAQKRRIPLCPVNTVKDLLDNPQLNERQFFQELHINNSEYSVKYPGPPYRFNEIEWSLRDSAPKLGEHTDEILGILGYSIEKSRS